MGGQGYSFTGTVSQEFFQKLVGIFSQGKDFFINSLLREHPAMPSPFLGEVFSAVNQLRSTGLDPIF